MGKFPFQFVYFKFITVTVLAIVEFGSGQTNQTLAIGNDDPCAADLGVPSPSDNLSCEFVPPGGTFCYSRSELCNGDQICLTGSDEGANIAALDCTGNRTGTGVPTFECTSGENVSLANLCDGNADCAAGDDETTPLCENKCRLPYYAGCPFTRECLSSTLDVGCPSCLFGFVEDPADPGEECLSRLNITLEFPTYNTNEEDSSVEVCAMLDDGMIEAGQSFDVFLGTLSGTASTADFGELNPPAVLTFTSTQQRACANVVIIDDNIVDPLEFFTVTLSSTNFQVNVLIRNALVIISDNDVALLEFIQIMYIGLEGAASVPFAVQLASGSGVLSQPVTATIISDPQAGSALENIDYVPVGLVQLTFPAGSGPLTSLGGTIELIEDVLVEANEIVQLTATITEGTGSFTPNGSSTMIVIQDNDVLTIGFQPITYPVNEAMGAIEVCFEVEENTVLDVAAQAILNTVPGSAIVSVDFTPIMDEVVDLPIGTNLGDQFCRNITILQDGEPENIERFTVQLTSNSPFVAINPDRSIATVNILSDRIIFQFSQANFNVSEGAAEVCIDLTSGVLSTNTAIVITPRIGSAGVLDPQTVVFPVGSAARERRCINITYNESTLVESFSIEAQSNDPNVGFSPGGAMAMVTIIDDDRAIFQFSQTNFNASEGTAEVCIDLTSGVLSANTDIVITPQIGSAGAMDPQTVVFPVGSAARERRCLNITFNESTLVVNESFSIVADSNDSNVGFSPGGATAMVTIIDDRAIFQFSQTNFNVSEGTAEVCIDLTSGVLSTNTAIVITPQIGSAGTLDPQTVVFPVGSAARERRCINITFNESTLVVNESFSIVAGSNDPNVGFSPGDATAMVTIIDDDRAIFQFSQTNFNVSEGVAEVCIDLTSGVLSINTAIVITPQISSTGAMDPQTVVFPVGSAARERRRCINITFNESTLVESFSIEAQSNDPNVEFSPGGDMATVTIIDDDSSGSGDIPPSQCIQTFTIMQDGTDIDVMPGVVNCFSCALESMSGIAWQVEMNGRLVPVLSSPDAVVDGNFLIIEMPDDYVPLGPSGGRNITCTSLFDGQSFEARLTSMDVRCDAETTSTENGMTYSWPATLAGETVIFTCPTRLNVLVMRNCSSEGLWQNVTDDGCESVTQQLLRFCRLFANLTTETYVDSVAALSQITDLTEDNVNEQTDGALSKTASFFKQLAGFLDVYDVIINKTVIEDAVDVIDSFLQWEPENITVASSSCLVESFEIIASTYAQQIPLNVIKTFITPSFTVIAEVRSVDSLSQSGRSFLIGDDDLLLGFEDEVQPGQLPAQFDAAISLPATLFQRINDRLNVGIYFAHYEIPSLFPVAGESGRSSLPRQTVVGSDSIAVTVGPGLDFENLVDPVTVVLRLQVAEESFIAEGSEMCVSWDFILQDWTTEGCTTIIREDGVVTCNCNHLTNFAVLVDICLRQEDCERSKVDTALTYISYIGISVSIACLVFTLLTLLVFKTIREKDISKYHIQLCSALLCMYILTLILVVLSAERVDTIYGGCVSLSLLVHYFTLAAVMWMGAEALLIFQKLVIVFVRITIKFMLLVSIVCWTVPIAFVLLPFIVDMANGRDSVSDIIIQRAKTKDDIAYCFLSHIGALMGAFLVPIFLIMVANAVFFVWVIVVLVRHAKGTAKRMKQTVTNKQILRIMFSISGVLFLFGLTWGFFILTFSVAGLREIFQILFTIFNSLQGFFIFVFILFTEGFSYWKELLSCKKQHKSKSTQPSGPATKSSNTPNIRPRQEKRTPEIFHHNVKTTDIDTHKKLGLTLSSNTSSSELVSIDTSSSGNQISDVMYPNDQELNIVGSEKQDLEGKVKEKADSMPLRVLIRRYSTKKYKQHHVEEMKVEFFDEDDSSSDEDALNVYPTN